MESKNIAWLKDLRKTDLALVGGKNASMGEMYSQLAPKGIRLPNAFALTSDSFWYYLRFNRIDDKMTEIFRTLDVKDLKKAREASKTLMNLVIKGKFPPDLENEILANYAILSQEYGENEVDVSVRSSATAEDLPTASFAGQHESFLNIRGKNNLLNAVKNCFASLYTHRAIAYRDENNFDHTKIALSVLVQKMVRSDLASSGVMFTLDTESGFRDIVLINAIYGLGELIVKGKITPDTFHIFKPTLKQGFCSLILKNIGRKTTKYAYAKNGGWQETAVSPDDQKKYAISADEALQLARWAVQIEEHYNMPMDIEWAKDGKTNELYIVQSRPETVHARQDAGRYYEEYKTETQGFTKIAFGIAVGSKIGKGKVKVIADVSNITDFEKGQVLVTRMTDPDWVPVMRIASAIVTDEGGTTSHAAIVSRELGIPCIVGSKNGSKILKTGDFVTVDCSIGREGAIYLGDVPFSVKKYDLREIPELPVKIAMNIGTPDNAYKYSSLPVEGVGLAREEFIIAEKIKAHPLALLNYQTIDDDEIRKKIDEITYGYNDKTQYFIDELAEGVSQIAAAFYPRDIIVRFSDFKTNEYETLIGGKLYEPKEENPMIGWRGCSRYYDEKFKPAFKLECLALRKAREEFGLKNIQVMLPFCRTPEEARKVMAIMDGEGLKRGVDNLKVYIMCEIPSNVILAEEFLEICDGFSIGSNDLTQCLMGMDRDNAIIAPIANETNETVKRMIKQVIEKCNQMGKYSGICGDAPSSLPEFAQFLIDCKIKSISLSPDAVIKTLINLSNKKNV